MYPKVLYLLTWVVATCVTTENITLDKEINLPTPSIYGISEVYEGGPTILWLLNDKNETYVDETVLGYKVKLWQVGCDKKPKFKVADGERVRLKNVMPRLRDYSTLRNLTEFTVEGVDNCHLWLKDIEPNVPYHMMVAAYSASGVGPLSSPFRFQHRGRYTCREL